MPYGANANGSANGANGQAPVNGQNKGRLEIRVIKLEPPKPENSGQQGNLPPGQGNPNSQTQSDMKLFIPAGSILSGNLLNGLDAPTGKGARREPFPVLARLKVEAILPNRFRADVRECFLVSAGYGRPEFGTRLHPWNDRLFWQDQVERKRWGLAFGWQGSLREKRVSGSPEKPNCMTDGMKAALISKSGSSSPCRTELVRANLHLNNAKHQMTLEGAFAGERQSSIATFFHLPRCIAGQFDISPA